MGAQISSLSNWPCVSEEHVEIDCQKISLNSYKTSSTSDKSLFHICDKLVHKQTVRTLWRKILLTESNVRLNSILLTFLIVEVHPPYLSLECFPLLPERKTVGYFSITVPGIAEQC